MQVNGRQLSEMERMSGERIPYLEDRIYIVISEFIAGKQLYKVLSYTEGFTISSRLYTLMARLYNQRVRS